MRKTFLFLLIFVSFKSFSKIDVKVYYEKTAKGFEIFADNNELCPISILIDFKLKNLKSSQGNNRIFVLPAKAKKVSLTNLVTINNGKYTFSYKTKYNYGNHFLEIFEKEFIYSLPFENNSSFLVYQGYNGSFSHQNENALDFEMPIGTKILAVRDGIVIKVIDENSKTCDKKVCIKYNNYIIIYHKDGTFSEYAHIKKEGAMVKRGDEIKKGQVIAKSGNVGYSSGPHLHFQVFFQKLKSRTTLKTKFKINNGGQSEYLIEKRIYSRNYN